MATPTQRDLEFVVKARDRTKAATQSAGRNLNHMGAQAKESRVEISRLGAQMASLENQLRHVTGTWSTFLRTLSITSLTANTAGMAQSFGMVSSTSTAALVAITHLAARVELLPPKLHSAAKTMDVLTNGTRGMQRVMGALAKSDNPFLKLFGNTALPLAQIGAVGAALAALRAGGGIEKAIFGGGVIAGPLIPYVERLSQLFKGRLVQGLRDSTNNFWGFGRAIQFAQTMTHLVQHPLTRMAASLAVIGGSAAAVRVMQDFDRALYRIHTVGGAPVEFLDAIGHKLQQLASVYGIRSAELGGALERIIGAGYDGAAAFDVLKASALGANLGFGDVVQTQAALVPMLAVYSDEVLDASHATSILQTAIREGAADADTYATSLGNVFGLAKASGVHLEELLGLVSAYTVTGQSASQAVVAVRQALTDLTGPSRQAIRLMDQFWGTGEVGSGAAFIREQIQMHGLLDTVKMVREQVTNPIDFARLFDQVEGRNAIMSWTGAIEEQTRASIENIRNTSVDLAETSFAAMSNSADLAARRGTATFNRMLQDLGGVIIPPLNAALRFLADNIEMIGLVAGLVFVNIIMQLVDLALASAIVKRLGAGIRLFGVQLMGVGPALAAFGARLSMMAGQAWRALTQTRISFAGLINSFNATMMKLRTQAALAGQFIRLAMINPVLAAQGVAIAARIAGMKIGSAIGKGIQFGLKVAGGVFTWLLANMMDWIWTLMLFGDMMDAPFQVMGETVKLGDVAEGVFKQLGVTISGMWTEAVRQASAWYERNKHYVDQFVQLLSQIWTTIQPVLVLIGNSLEGTVKAIMFIALTLADAVQLVWNFIGDVVHMFATLGGAVMKTFEIIGRRLSKWFADVGKGFSKIWNDVVKFFSQGAEALGLGDLADALGAFFASGSAGAMNLGEAFVSAMRTAQAAVHDMALNAQADMLKNLPGPLRETAANALLLNTPAERQMILARANGGAAIDTAAETARRETARLARLVRESGEGEIGRAWSEAFSSAFDFSATSREFDELRDHASQVGAAYNEAFTNDASNAQARARAAARTTANAWEREILAARARRIAGQQYVGDLPGTPGTISALGSNPVNEDLSTDTGPTDTTAGRNRRDPYETTLTSLQRSVDETYRLAEANEMWGAAQSAGLEDALKLVEAGHAELATTQEIHRLSELRALVEEKSAQDSAKRIEDMQLGVEAAQRELAIRNQMMSGPEQAAALAMLEAEIDMRRERRNISQEELEIARQTGLQMTRISASNGITDETRRMQQEITAIRDRNGLVYQSAYQYAMEGARLDAVNELRRRGIDLMSAEARAYITAAQARAGAEMAAQNRTVSAGEAMRQVLDNMRSQSQNVGADIADSMGNAVASMSDAFTDFAMGAQTDFKGMAASILADMARIIMRAMIMRAVTSMMGGPTSIAAPVFATPLATGGWFDGPLHQFAKGSAFVNGIFSDPTLFRFASGGQFHNGVMGEAGPEAVMPLTKIGGKLGVQATIPEGAGGGQMVFAPQISITVNADNQSDGQNIADLVGKQVKAILATDRENRARQQQRNSGRLGLA